MKVNVSKEYSIILSQYMDAFGLADVDIAFLIGSNKDAIIGLLDGTRGAVLKTLESISQIFGLRYFEFGNPNHSMPNFDSLPDRTKERIAYRKKVGHPVPKTYTSLDLTEKISVVLSEYKVGYVFLPSEIGNKVDSKFNLGLTDYKQITDRFKKDLEGIVEKTGKTNKVEGKRGRPEEYYRLIKPIAKSKKSK
ncbi:hypothetical protein [Olivibacter sp. XZL3]|uniref:hypothetical protein n=1 Tax=Olivibacter sp. XZL3 TaxID=1735116 RepID=UPI0010665231|nr:hypothetical protein [Olivibacter sp. XZL3]